VLVASRLSGEMDTMYYTNRTIISSLSSFFSDVGVLRQAWLLVLKTNARIDFLQTEHS